MPVDWNRVARVMRGWTSKLKYREMWKAGQEDSLLWIAKNIYKNKGLLLADEVGLGKTRVAVAAAFATLHEEGGRVVVLLPSGLLDQWIKEFQAFKKSLKNAGSGISIPDHHILRTYDDLFSSKEGQLLCQRSLLFVSHRFGIPQNLVDTELRKSNESRWLLPMRVRSVLARDGRSVPGLKIYGHNEKQEIAVNYLAEKIRSTPLGETILNCKMLVPIRGPSAYKTGTARFLFQRLIGELIGNIDLLIIDEAHKNRAGADDETLRLQSSRLSECVNLILRPAAGEGIRHLGLTATPLELDVKQWRDVFARIGLDKTDIDELCNTTESYEKLLRNMSWFDGMDIEHLKKHCKNFTNSLKGVVSRRRWRDHESIKDFTKLTDSTCWDAHPHRSWMEYRKSISDLPDNARRVAFACECLAQVNKGTNATLVDKGLGHRFSQAQDFDPEMEENIDKVVAKLTSKDEGRSEQRKKYWSDVRLEAYVPELRSEAKFRLQAHPRVLLAIKLIENLMLDNSKVLVFGAFNKSLEALTRALNIRHFIKCLKDIHTNRPALLPSHIRINDLDVIYWASKLDINLSDEKVKNQISDMRNQYEKSRDSKRETCRAVFKNEIKGYASKNSKLKEFEQRLETAVVDWLVFSLPQELARRNVKDEANRLLHKLFDLDPPEDAIEGGKIENAEGGGSLDVNQILRSLDDELGIDNYSYDLNNTKIRSGTSSGIASLMYGKTKPPTRRTLQYRFNHKHMNPRILIAQAAVASEGLNLHEACRKIVLFHLDWNPARIEQQIGRIDRQGSLWMKEFTNNSMSINNSNPPRIEIYTLALEGTYDDHRRQVVIDRQKTLKSQLFGELTTSEVIGSLSGELQNELAELAPDLRP